MRSFPLTGVAPLAFFASGLVPPIMLELSSVSRTMEGVGCMLFILGTPLNHGVDTLVKMLTFMGHSTSRSGLGRQVSGPPK